MVRKTRSRKRIPLSKCKKVKNYFHCVINSKTMFDKRSFRAKKVGRGRIIILGCPKNRWNQKTKRCRVSTKIQKLLRPI